MIHPVQRSDDCSFGRWGSLAILAGLATLVSALFTPERAWASALLMAYYLLTIGLGAVVFIAVSNVTGAGWHVAIRRVPEALTSLLPVGALLVVGLLVVQSSRYSWHAHGHGDPGTFWFKDYWLIPGFLIFRSVIYCGLWIAFSLRLVSQSRRQDQLRTPASHRVGTATSALFLAFFAVTFSLASVDWIMALEPLWFSTMWGVYHFSGMFQSTLAVVVIGCVLLRRGGQLQGVFRDEHLHDLGKLLLGFSCFWMYIWFCQYMLIWYSNIPEETVYFTSRLSGGWGPMVVASLVLNWVIPFFFLLPRKSKRSETIMIRVSGVVLIGRWIDLSVMIYPPVVGDSPALSIPEIAGALAGFGLTIWLFERSFRRAAPVPIHDPFLQESMHYVN